MSLLLTEGDLANGTCDANFRVVLKLVCHVLEVPMPLLLPCHHYGV